MIHNAKDYVMQGVFIRKSFHGICTFRHACLLSCFSGVRLFATQRTVAHQAPLSMGFSRQECWSGLPFPPSEDVPDPGMKGASSACPARAGRFFTTCAKGRYTEMTGRTDWRGLEETVVIIYVCAEMMPV